MTTELLSKCSILFGKERPLETMLSFHGPSRTQCRLLGRHTCVDLLHPLASVHTAAANGAAHGTLYYRLSPHSSTENKIRQRYLMQKIMSSADTKYSIYKTYIYIYIYIHTGAGHIIRISSKS